MRSKNPEMMFRIKDYIENYFASNSSTPTVREIAGSMKVAVSTAHRYLVEMTEKGMVYYENGHLSTPKIQRMTPEISPAAIVSSIPCGTPNRTGGGSICRCPFPFLVRATSMRSGPPAIL